MIYDELGIYILKTILEEGDLTTYGIAKLFDWEGELDKNKKNNEPFWRAKSVLVRKRLEGMEKENLVKVIKECRGCGEKWLKEEKKESCPDCGCSGMKIKNTFVVVKDNVKILEEHLFIKEYHRALVVNRKKGGHLCIFQL